jgi:tetratricopeptide (TPR) repeat protein
MKRFLGRGRGVLALSLWLLVLCFMIVTPGIADDTRGAPNSKLDLPKNQCPEDNRAPIYYLERQGMDDIKNELQSINDQEKVDEHLGSNTLYSSSSLSSGGGGGGGSAVPVTAQDYSRLGWEYYNQEKYDYAISNFTKAIQMNPYLAGAYNGRGWAYHDINEQDLAIADFTRAITLDNNYANAYCGRGWSYEWKGDYESALVDFNRAILLDPVAAGPYNGRGWCYYYQRNYTDAIKNFTQAIHYNPNYMNAYQGRAWSYEAIDNYNAALADYNQAIRLVPDNPRNYYWRANIYYYQFQKYQEAIADYSMVIQLDKDEAARPWIYGQRGNCYFELGQYQPAIQDYTIAIQLQKEERTAGYLNDRGRSYYMLGLYEPALQDFTRAIEIDPSYPEPYAGRAWVYYKQGKYEEAAEAFNNYTKQVGTYDNIQTAPLIDFTLNQTSMELSPLDTPVILNRGEACKFMVRLQGIDYSNVDISFSDLSPDHKNYYYIAAAVQSGLIAGYPDGSFRPEWGLTRATYATLLIKTLNYPWWIETSSAPDIQGHWAYSYCAAAINAGLMNLYPDGTFRPNDYMEMVPDGQLIALIAPLNAANKRLIWSSSNPNVAAVDQCGQILAKSIGEAVITARSTEGNITKTCNVKVTMPKIEGRVGVVIDNHDAALPQAGLNNAEAVFETAVAPGITRFLALYDIYHFNNIQKIGPVRSARGSLVCLAAGAAAGLAHAGGSDEALALIPSTSIFDIDEIYGASTAFYRSTDRIRPHNLYTGSQLLASHITTRIGQITAAPDIFTRGTMAGGEPADQARARFYGQTSETIFKWNGTAYERLVADKKVCSEDGISINTRNVVIIYTSHDNIYRPELNEWETRAYVQGEGSALIYRDGKKWYAEWKKPTIGSQLLLTVNGKPACFAPGNIWFLIVESPQAPCISSINIKNGEITPLFQGMRPNGLNIGDFAVSARLDGNNYSLQNLSYNNGTISFRPVPPTTVVQKLTIKLGNASSSTKLSSGTVSKTINIAPIGGAGCLLAFKTNSTIFYINGEYHVMDVPPVIINNHFMVPIRFMAEGLGLSVGWDADTQTTVFTGPQIPTVKITVGCADMLVNDQVVTMDVGPVIINGRTFAPAKYLAEAFGFSVLEDGNSIQVFPAGQLPDYQPPSLKNTAISEDNKTITLVLDEKILSAGPGLEDKISIALNGGEFTPIKGSAAVTIQDDRLVISMNSPLIGNTAVIRISTNAIKDWYDNLLEETVITPLIYIQNGEVIIFAHQIIPGNHIWTIEFSQPVDRASINTDNITIINSQGKRVALNFEIMPDGLKVKLHPDTDSQSYPPGDYTLFVNRNIKRMGGDLSLKSSVRKTFSVQAVQVPGT